MTVSECLLADIRGILGGRELTIVWELPQFPEYLYAYTVVELGVIACAESVEKICAFVVSTVLDSHADNCLHSSSLCISVWMQLLSKVSALYFADELAFRHLLSLDIFERVETE